MVVCKYFLQGRCNFGSRCRFEHVSDDRSSGYSGRYDALSNYNEDDGSSDYHSRHTGSNRGDQGDYHDKYSSGKSSYRGSGYQGNSYSGDTNNYDGSYRGSGYQGNSNRGSTYQGNSNRGSSYQSGSYGGGGSYGNDYRGAGYQGNRYRSDDGYDSQYSAPQSGYSQGNSYRGSQEDNNRYKYQADSYKPSGSSQGNQAAKTDPSYDEIILLGIEEEMKSWESSGMWPFSCFGMGDMRSFPGLDDISPEEARWAFYEARESGSLPTYMQSMSSMFLDYKDKRNQLLNLKTLPRDQITRIFDDLQTASASSDSSASKSMSVFGSAPANGSSQVTGNQLFGGGASQNPFGSISSPSQPPESGTSQVNIFQQSSDQISGSSQGPSVFGAASVFGGSVSSTSNVFGAAFGSTAAPVAVTAGPGGVASGGVASVGVASGDVAVVTGDASKATVDLSFYKSAGSFFHTAVPLYSSIADLTAEELAEFKADKFTSGAIPIRPPPKELVKFLV